MKFAVLGSGNGARAWCGQIAAKGYPVVMWEPLSDAPDFTKLKTGGKISLKGDINLTGKLAGVTMNIEEAMDGAEMILVIVPSFAHEPIFTKMIPHLKDGQHVVVVPGNFAAYRLRDMMTRAGCTKQISISTTETMPYACRISEFDTVHILKKKYAIHLASSPVAAGDYVRNVLNDAFDGYVTFEAVEHILVQDLSNINYVMHPYPVLLNYGEIEKHPTTYRHYMDGITPLISEQMGLLDEERLMIGEKLGFKLESCLALMKKYYGQNDAKNLDEYVHSPETPYEDLIGQNVRSRYITEDVPGVLMPIARIAHKAGIATPRTDTIITFASQLHGTDYWNTGTTLASLGLEDKSIDEILHMMK